MARLTVRLQPRASRTAIVGFRDDGVLLVRVTEPPVDGRANNALCKLLARQAGVAASRVSLVRGDTGRDKVVEIDGVSDHEARAKLQLGGR